MENLEIEAKFLSVDPKAIAQKLLDLGAKDLGRRLQRQVIYYDAPGKWIKDGKTFVRLRQENKTVTLTYKKEHADSLTGVEEIEFQINDWAKAEKFLEAVGLKLVTETEKYRHTFELDDVSCDIDEWPKIPPWLEIEGPTEEAVKAAAAKLGFSWKDAVFGTAPSAIEKHYKIVLRKLRYFTFDRVE